MERRIWTDDRIDDMVDRLDTNMERLHEEMHDMRAETRELRLEMRAGFAKVDERFARMETRMEDGIATLRHQMLQAVLVMSSMLVATMVTILVKTL
jgi:uncharacterized protein YPO0396